MITVYFLFVMCMSTVSVTASVLVISLHFRNPKAYKMPLWVSLISHGKSTRMFVFQIRKYICHYLARLLHMKRPEHDLTWYSIRHRFSSTIGRSNSINNHIDIHYPKCPTAAISNNNTNISKPSFRVSINREKEELDSMPKISVSPTPTLQHAHDDHRQSSTVSQSCEINTIYSELHTIISHLAIITDHIWRQEKHDNESQEWKFVAMVIDRLCLILFMIFITIFTTIAFLSAYNLYIFQ